VSRTEDERAESFDLLDDAAGRREPRMPPPGVLLVHERVSDLADLILKEFKPGAKITILVRRPPSDGSQDYVLTSEADLREAIRALEIRRENRDGFECRPGREARP
jgi:hypothetical protein